LEETGEGDNHFSLRPPLLREKVPEGQMKE
jgi:hypothetical protein